MHESLENKRLVKALFALLERNWNRRIWVQQEAAMNPETFVMCGDRQIRWENFFSLAWLLTARTSLGWPEWVDHEYALIAPSLSALTIIQQNRLSVQKVSLHEYRVTQTHYADTGIPSNKMVFRGLDELLGHCASCEATDPRDKVYALLNLEQSHNGLCHDPKGLLNVDYGKPWQTVYIQTARWLYENQPMWIKQSFDRAGRSRQLTASDIPSWVPDWRHDPPVDLTTHLQWSSGGFTPTSNAKFVMVSRRQAQADKMPKYSCINSRNERKALPNVAMETTCILLDKIVWVSPVLPSFQPRGNRARWRRIVKAILEHIRGGFQSYFTQEPINIALAATMIADTTHEDEMADTSYYEGFERYLKWLEIDDYNEPPAYGNALHNAEVYYTLPLCTTAHGLMCLVPKMANEGDYVAVISGSRKPVALRRTSAPPKQQYELLGNCYIHGMMQNRPWDLIMDHKCRYEEGSEDVVEKKESTCGSQVSFTHSGENSLGTEEVHSSLSSVLKVLGKRRILLV